MNTHRPHFDTEQPIQYLLAEDLSVEWLEQERAFVQERIGDASGGLAMAMQCQLACNTLELGIHQGSTGLVDEAFDDFSTLVNHPEYDIHHRSSLTARALLAGREAFCARTEREEELSPTAMSTVFAQTMNILEEASDLEASPRKSHIMTALIAFGSVARQKRQDYFPYFLTYREQKGDPPEANHEVYVAERQQGQLYKVPASTLKKGPRWHKIYAGEQIQTALMQDQRWYREMRLPWNGPQAKPVRLQAAADLLVSDSRSDQGLLSRDKAVLGRFSRLFCQAIGHATDPAEA